MTRLAKRIKAVVCASILVASTAIASLVPATQVKAAAPTGSISIVAQDEYKAGETVKIKTTFSDATKVTYEFYSKDFNPYYGYGTRKFTVEKELPGTPVITSGDDVVIDIPSNARGTYTVKAVFENAIAEKTTVTAATKLSVKNSSYDKSMAYYYMYGNGGSISDPYLYYLLADDENTDKNALLYYYMSNNGGSSTVPSWYYYYLLDDDEDNDKNALLYYYYLNNNSTSSTVPSWYYYYLLDDEDNDNDALLYYYYLNNTSSTIPPFYYYLLSR
ncbi:MAG: hypothetical protein ACI4D0_09285 [Lachnospira sp.]